MVTTPYGSTAASAVLKTFITYEDLTLEEKHILKLELIPWVTLLKWVEAATIISSSAVYYFIGDYLYNAYNYTAPVASKAVTQVSSTLVYTANYTTGIAEELFNKLPTMYTSTYNTISPHATKLNLDLAKMWEPIYNVIKNGGLMNHATLDKFVNTIEKGYCLSVGTAGELVKASSYLASFYIITKTHNIGAVGANWSLTKLPFADKIGSLLNKLPMKQAGLDLLHALNYNLLQWAPKAMWLSETTAGVIGNAYTTEVHQ